jgi:hypothetical protein
MKTENVTHAELLMDSLIAALKDHKFNTTLQILFHRMIGPVGIAFNIILEARVRRLSITKDEMTLGEILPIVINEIQADLDRISNESAASTIYLYAPYKLGYYDQVIHPMTMEEEKWYYIRYCSWSGEKLPDEPTYVQNR